MRPISWCALSILSLSWLAACSDGTVTTAKDTTSGGSGGSSMGVGGDAGAAGADPTTTTTSSSMGGSSAGGTGQIPTGLSLGADCSAGECRTGLECVSDVCELSGETKLGEPCFVSGECEAGLVCVAQECAPAGTGQVGDGCQNDLDCESGLRCGLTGFAAQCQPEGTLDVGGSCEASSECLGGLGCFSNLCLSPPLGTPAFGLPSWNGVECNEPSESGVRAYFEVPGAEDAQEADFFRLPFPNDVRLVDGSLDLSGFPTPGAGLLGVDPVQIYLDKIAESHHGWGTEPYVIFRFSGHIDHNTLTSDEAATEGRVRFVDVSPNIPEAEREGNVGWQMYYTTAPSNYVCHNWIAISRPLGNPLRPGHTYAVILTTGARDIDGNAIERSENLMALLGDSAPSDSALEDAYAAYAPLRDYLASDNGNSTRLNLSAEDVLNASVITVHDHHAPMTDLADAVAAEFESTAVEVKNWALCSETAESPCPDREGSRACGAGTADYDEYHALVTLPIFQEGTAPDLTSGGGISPSGKVRDEDVCMSLTVPKGQGADLPLAIYAHGTGGSFRAHVRDEVAGALARAGVAVLGIDQVQHGPRRGDSKESPQNLFFNFLNPDAALGNPLQGAADQLALIKLAENFAFTAEQTQGVALSVDPSKVVFIGHSQGSIHGSVMLPYSSVPGAVLSGNAAGLRYSLLEKTQPVNLAAALPFVLLDPANDGTLNMAERHPALGMLQQWIDAADPYNFAEMAASRPADNQTSHHIFQTFGLDDSYSPPTALFAYALAARASMAPLGGNFTPEEPNVNSRLTPGTSAVSANVGNQTTVALRQYQPAQGSDGHFVMFDDATANEDMVKFVEALQAGSSAPSVGD